jgi:hypothetical protein
MNMEFLDRYDIVEGLKPMTPSSSTPDYVSLKNYEKCTVVIHVANATTVTGSAITIKQATAVAGTGEKALAFTTMKANIDCAASATWVVTAVVSNTFTTDATNSKNLMYVIEVDPSSLDIAGGFDCFRAGTGNATAAVLDVVYILEKKYPGTVQTAAITD